MASFKFSFRPKLIDSLKGYDGERFAADLGAGVTVGLVALPLAMAFAVASGVKPESGIFTAIIAGFLISALGGSRVQIGGPAGAFIVIIYGIVQQYGLANLFISTMMAGVLLFITGLTGIGSFIRFIPIAIVIGFTNGIAVTIALSQVKDFLGLAIDKMPAEFFAQIRIISSHIDTLNWTTLALGMASLAVILLWPRLTALLQRNNLGRPNPLTTAIPGTGFAFFARIPGTIIALVLATLAAITLDLPVETIGSRFGGIPQSLPAMALPAFEWSSLRGLFAPTITIALLGAIESLLCARVADSAIGDRHDPNQELMAQGIANFISPLFGGLPATGTIARTTTNVRAGAKTPIAGIVHALTLFAIVLVAAPLAKNIPLSALAGILLFVAWNMGEWREFARLKQFSMNYRIVMLATFLLTVIFDLTVAVEVGLVLASLFFIYRVSDLTKLEPIDLKGYEGAALREGEAPHHVAAYKLFGSLFFGAVGKIEALLDHSRENITVVILEMHQVINIDTTGLDALEALHDVLLEEGRHLILAGLTQQPASLIRRSGFIEELGEANVASDLSAALLRARQLVDSSPKPV
jgi:SulP family sulfate permease